MSGDTQGGFPTRHLAGLGFAEWEDMTRLAPMLGLLLFSCAVDSSVEEDAWSEPGKFDGPSAGGVTPTHSTEVRVLDGFNALLDSKSGHCVEPVGDGPAYSVGAIEKPFDLSIISSKEDLARTLGVDVGLKIKYSGTSVGPTVHFLDTFKQTGSATHLLLAARASYKVTNTKPVQLTAAALQMLTEDRRTFMHRCGNTYVNGVQLEAQLFVMIRLDAQTDEAARTISADLGIGAGTDTLGIDATLAAKLDTLAKREDIRVDMHVLDRGFLADGGTTAVIASLLGSGLSADSFAKIDSVRAAMLASLNGDACRDGGQGLETCPAGDRPGYAANMARNAVPVNIDLRTYARVENGPLGGPGSVYEEMRNTIDGASRYLRSISSVAARLETISKDEVELFLNAPPANKANFSVAPPAPPVFTVDALSTIANRFRTRFDPTRADSVAMNVERLISDCWSSALEGAIESCAVPGDQSLSTVPAVQAAESAIADYVATGRVVPLRYASLGVMRYRDAYDACALVAKRLPTFAEAQRLAIPIGFANLQRSTDTAMRFIAWHNDASMCGNNLPGFSNSPGGIPGNVCTSESVLWPKPATTLCVPPGGPFDQIVEP